MDPYSIYLHIPFCRHRCAYCDFNTYAGIEDLIPTYVEALNNEIEVAARSAGETLPVHSVFFGGGTPSLLSPLYIEGILQTLDENFNLDVNSEISLEANPGTVSMVCLQDLRIAGVNRISLGMQSAQTEELAFLERQHRYIDVIEAVKWARQTGFDNINLDLIFGLPEQRIEAWEGSLTLALDLAPEHFSLYALTLEHGTPMQHWAARGLISTPDPDLAAEMYELAGEKLTSAGYLQYEISNWAKAWDGDPIRTPKSAIENPQLACCHNLQYWRNQPYLGFGAGAHGFVAGFRTSNVLSPSAYIDRLSQSSLVDLFPHTPATIDLHPIDLHTEMGETMMMGLRLTREGISKWGFSERFGRELQDVFGAELDRLISMDLLEWIGDERDVLRLAPAGRLLGNRVFREFV